MTKLKQTYLSPETDLLVVRFEENIMSPNYGGKNQPGSGLGEDPNYSYDY